MALNGLWIDPSDDDVVTLAGSPERITAIADKSLSGNDVAESGSPLSGPLAADVLVDVPVRAMQFNSGGLLSRVNASPDLFDMDGPDFTVIIALSDNGAIGTGEGIMGVSGAASPLDDTGWRLNKPSVSPDDGRIRASVGDEETNEIDVRTPASPVGFEGIIALEVDQSANYFAAYSNGVQQDSQVFSGSLGFANDLSIGSLPGVGAFESGDIYEIVYVDRLLRSDERQRVEGYLAHKWGISETLPLNHPFYDQAPDIVEDVELIINFNGVDGDGTSQTALTGQNVTLDGNAELDDSNVKYGSTSLLLDGSGDSATVPDEVGFDLDGDFTMECWFAPSNVPTVNEDLITKYNASQTQRSWIFGFDTAPGAELRLVWSTNGAATSFNTSTDMPVLTAGQFHHAAACRRGDVLSMFLDGVKLTLDSDTLTGSPDVNDSDVIIGDRESGNGEFTGNIDSVRLVKGRALYEYDFTPPHRGFVLPSPSSLLANFNGPDPASPQAYTSEDAGARVATFEGDARLDTAQKKFGISSLLCDTAASPLSYVSFPSSVDFDFATGDFTVEVWIRLNSLGTFNFISWGSSTQGAMFVSSGVPSFQTAGVTRITAAGALTVGVWYHMVVQRRGAEYEMFTDGVSDGVNSTAVTFDQAVFVVGHRIGSSAAFDGWIDGARAVKGVALYSVDSPGFLVPFDAPGEPII